MPCATFVDETAAVAAAFAAVASDASVLDEADRLSLLSSLSLYDAAPMLQMLLLVHHADWDALTPLALSAMDLARLREAANGFVAHVLSDGAVAIPLRALRW